MITSLSFIHSRPAPFVARAASLALAAMLVLATASAAGAQKSFRTADEAADALVSAVKTGEPRSILAVLGRDGTDIVSSGREVADATARQRVVTAYDPQQQIAMEGDSKA